MMKRRRNLLSAALLSLVLCGCAGTTAATRAVPEIPVAIRPTSYVTVAEARAERDGDHFYLRGSLRRTGPLHLTGHVDVLVLGPDGSTVARETVAVPGLNSRRGGVFEVPFAATVPGVVPEGARVILRYHAPPFAEELGEDLSDVKYPGGVPV